MESIVTFGQIIAVFSAIVIPLFIWGVSVEKTKEKVKDNAGAIETLKQEFKESNRTNQNNFDKVLSKLHSIELVLKDKKDRE